jgi:hypothetical protein
MRLEVTFHGGAFSETRVSLTFIDDDGRREDLATIRPWYGMWLIVASWLSSYPLVEIRGNVFVYDVDADMVNALFLLHDYCFLLGDLSWPPDPPETPREFLRRIREWEKRWRSGREEGGREEPPCPPLPTLPPNAVVVARRGGLARFLLGGREICAANIGTSRYLIVARWLANYPVVFSCSRPMAFDDTYAYLADDDLVDALHLLSTFAPSVERALGIHTWPPQPPETPREFLARVVAGALGEV